MHPRPRSLLAFCLVLSALLCLRDPGPCVRPPAAARPPAAPAPETLVPDWWGRVQDQLRRSEYFVSWQESTCLPDLARAYHAPNRAQDLRTYFTPDGFRMTRRTGPQPAWEWGLRLAAYGFAGATRAPLPAALAADGNRIEYRRGPLTEWYVNDERGLEQGFTLAAAPAPVGTPGAPLVIELAITGGLRPAGCATSAGAAVRELVLRDAGGVPRIRYGQLAALDAAGRALPSRMEIAEDGETVRLAVDAAGAEYPITVDPLSTYVSWSAEGDQSDCGFGAEVAGAGDVNNDGYGDVIVGAGGYDIGYTNEGAAFVYLGTPDGPALAPHWTGRGLMEGANFGNAVATAGDVDGDGFCDVVVGAPGHDQLADGGGAAFVFSGGRFGLGTEGNPYTAAWKWFGDVALGHFGQSVATAGDVNGDGYADVVVGAPYDKLAGESRGSARVFWGSGIGLGYTPRVLYGAQALSEFGAAVATAGDVNGDGYADVAVGLPRSDELDPGDDAGAVHVYYGPDLFDGHSQYWRVGGRNGAAHCGAAVATAGDVNGDGYADLLGGGPERSNGETSEGAVRVFFGSADGLSALADWEAEGNQAQCGFGRAVASAGDIDADGYADILVGVPHYDNPETNEGAVLVWYGAADGLGPAGSPANASWRHEGDVAGLQLGYSVAAAGDTDGDGMGDIIVGTPYYDGDVENEGRAYHFRGTKIGMASGMEWVRLGGQAGAQLGSAAAALDPYGYQHSCVVIGAPYYDLGQTDEGVVWMFVGRSHGEMSATPDWVGQGNQTGAHFGAAVGDAGDVNGDGFGDLIVGAPDLYDGGLVSEGHVFVWHGGFDGLGASGTPANADWSAEANIQDARFGQAVGTTGDVNGDGCSDIIVGVPGYDNAETNEGAVFVWHGSVAGLGALGTPANADWSAEANRAASGLGFSCGTAGDVNGDGYSDVIVGVPLYDVLITDTGRALTWYGSAAGLGAAGTPSNADWSASGNYGGGQFGYSVGTAGDENRDGYSDVVVGAPYHSEALAGVGKMAVYEGSVTGLSTSARVTRYGTQEGEHLGYSVGTAGDVNRDGWSDIFAGSPDYDGPHAMTDGGRVSIWTGPENTSEPEAANHTVFAGTGARLGSRVACAGDVNGDGYTDLIIGAPGYDADYADEGAAYIWFGGGTRLNRAMYPAQDNVPIESPVARFDFTDEATRFCLGRMAYSPFGTGKVKLEWELQPLGTPLDGTHLTREGPWTDLQARAYGTGLRAVVDAPASSDLHWRARIRYNPATTPLLTASPWFTLPGAGWNELHLRTPAPVVEVAPAPPAGGSAALAPAAPNPFGGSTLLRFTLPAPATVTLAVFDARGRCVRHLLRDHPATAGQHAIDWDARGDSGRPVAPGVYFAKLSTSGSTTSVRLVRIHE